MELIGIITTLEIIIPNGIQLEENGETLYKFSDIQSRI